MLWTIVLAVLTFDLIHRFHLVSVDDAKPDDPSIFARLADIDRKNARSPPKVGHDHRGSIILNCSESRNITQELGHLLLITIRDREIPPDEEVPYTIRCWNATDKYLTLTNSSNNTNTTTSSNNTNTTTTTAVPGQFKNLPFLLTKWNDTDAQKWRLDISENMYHVHSVASKDLPDDERLVASTFRLDIDKCVSGNRGHPIKIFRNCSEGFCCLGCNLNETTCRGNVREWVLVPYNSTTATTA